MIDTCDIRILPEQLRSAPEKKTLNALAAKLRRGVGLRTLQVHLVSDGSIVVSFSVPQVLYGSSMEEFNPVDADLLRQALIVILESLRIEVESVDALRICRLDICRNLEMSQPASQFIVHASRYAPHRVTVITAGSAWVAFRWNKRKSLTLYDKQLKEYRRPGGRTLRIELQLKGGQLVTNVLGISTFGDMLQLNAHSTDAILGSMLDTLLNVPNLPDSPSPADLWRSANLRRTRSVAPLFTAFYLSGLANPSANDLKAMKEQMRSSLSEKTYRLEKAAILDPVAAIPMDSIFRREVLDRLRNGFPKFMCS